MTQHAEIWLGSTARGWGRGQVLAGRVPGVRLQPSRPLRTARQIFLLGPSKTTALARILTLPKYQFQTQCADDLQLADVLLVEEETCVLKLSAVLHEESLTRRSSSAGDATPRDRASTWGSSAVMGCVRCTSNPPELVQRAAALRPCRAEHTDLDPMSSSSCERRTGCQLDEATLRGVGAADCGSI